MPRGRAAVGKADRLEHRHVELLQQLRHRFATFGSADHEVLQHHQRSRFGWREQGRQAFYCILGGFAPACEHYRAGHAALAAGGTDRIGRLRVARVEVQHRECRTGGQDSMIRFDFPVINAQAYRFFCLGSRQGGVGCEQVAHEGSLILAAAGLPQVVQCQPFCGCWISCSCCSNGLRQVILRQREFCGIGKLAHGAAGDAATQRERAVAIEGDEIFRRMHA